MIQLFSRNNKWLVVVMACFLMLFSLYVPYRGSVSIIYQLGIAAFIVLLGHDTASSVLAVFLLSTVRSYIAVSINERGQDVKYFGINGLILLLIILSLLFVVLYMREWRVHINWAQAFVIMFSIMMLSSIMWASNHNDYNKSFFAVCMMYVVLPFLFQDREDIVISRIAFILGGAFLAIGIIPQLLTRGTIYEVAVKVDRNYQACILLMCILETIIYLIKEGKASKTITKIACVVVIASDLYIVFTSASRSAIISLVIAGIIYLLVNYKKLNQSLAFILIAAIFILFAWELGILDFVLSRFELSNMQTANGRTDLWIRYLEGFESGNLFQILFGHGLTGFYDFGHAAHNVFVNILYAFGLVGITLFTLGILIIAIKLIKAGNIIEMVVFLPIMFMCCTIEPYTRIEFPIFISQMIGMTRICMEEDIEADTDSKFTEYLQE